MNREEFVKVDEEVLEPPPEKFRSPIQERRDSGRGFSAAPVAVQAGRQRRIASRHLSWRASGEEEHFDVSMGSHPHRGL